MSDVPLEHPMSSSIQTADLWLRALGELDPRHDDQEWYPAARGLAGALCAAAIDERAVLALINQALVLQQFLLEVACRPTRVRDRATIVHEASRLLREDRIVSA